MSLAKSAVLQGVCVTGADERYLWLNRIQAIGKGTLQEDGLSLDYEWYEVR